VNRHGLKDLTISSDPRLHRSARGRRPRRLLGLTVGSHREVPLRRTMSARSGTLIGLTCLTFRRSTAVYGNGGEQVKDLTPKIGPHCTTSRVGAGRPVATRARPSAGLTHEGDGLRRQLEHLTAARPRRPSGGVAREGDRYRGRSGCAARVEPVPVMAGASADPQIASQLDELTVLPRSPVRADDDRRPSIITNARAMLWPPGPAVGSASRRSPHMAATRSRSPPRFLARSPGSTQ
jgi:hypothetical protein